MKKLFSIAPSSADTPQLVIDPGGHKAMIRDVLFTPPDNQGSGQLLSVSDDKTIRIWDTASGELVRTLRGQMGEGDEGKLYAGALSPQDDRGRRWLAVGGYPSRWGIRLMDLQAPPNATPNAALRLLKGHADVILSLAFAPDAPPGKQGGRLLLSGSADNTARLWDVESGKLLKVLRGHTDHIYAVAISPAALSTHGNGKRRLVTGSNDHTLRLWDGAGKLLKVLEGHADAVMAAAFTPDGKHLISGSWDKTLRLWDGQTGAFVKRLAEQNRGVASLSISPDGKAVLTGSGMAGSGNIINHVFSLPDGRQLLRFREHKNLVVATTLSPDGRLAATGGGNDQEIILWDLATGKTRHRLAGKGNPIWSVGFARDGSGLAWGREPKTGGRVFHDTKLQQRFRLRAGGRLAPGFAGAISELSEDESAYLRAIQQVGETRIRTANGQIHPTLEIRQGDTVRHRITLVPSDGYRHRSLTLTPDGRTVISGAGNGVLASFDAASGKRLHEFIGHTGDVWAVAPSPDGKWLVSGSADQTARLWEIASGRPLLTIFPANNNEWVAWTPEGYYTASLNGDRLIGWHINQGEDKLARYYPAERFAKQFRKPRVVAHYLETGGDVDEAIALADAERPGRGPVTRGERVAATESTSPAEPTDPVDIFSLVPPMVTLIEPNESELTTHQPNLSLIVEARSDFNQEPVRELWVTVNGRNPGQSGERESTKGGQRLRLKLKLALDYGENEIAIYARNRHARSDPERLTVIRLGRTAGGEEDMDRPNLYLLAVGVADYARGSKEKGDLRYADDDARAVKRILEAQEGKLYRRVETLLLTDNDANRDNVLDGLDWLERESTQRDMTVIFFSGHGKKDGQGRYHFLPHDVDPEHLRRSAVKWREFQDTLDRLPGARWLLVDTCHSGDVTGGRGATGKGGADLTDALRDLREAAKGVVVMAAATGQEWSLEKEEWGHGAFTKALVEGLEEARANYNEDGRIDMKELDLYITQRVKALTGGRQHPMTEIPSVMRDFPVALVE